MSASRRLRDVVVVFVVLLVGVLVLRANARDPAQLNFIDRAVLRVSSPVQALLSAGARGVGSVWRRYVYLVGVERTSERLVDENRRLAAELSRAQLAAERTTRLEGLLSLRAQVPSETAAARVIGVESSPFFRVLRVKLDRGAGEVKPGMVVLVPEGVVGRVSRVYAGYCDVLLAVDPDSAIDVQVARTGARGVLKGVGGDNHYRAHIPELPRGEDAREGDLVVTSGIGGFPRELPVGTITRVIRPDSGLWQEVIIDPAVDFARLAEVLVVLAPPPPPDPDYKADTGRRAPEPHRGLAVPR